jgi:cell division protein YceG involved in septum cleavage
MAIDQKLTIPEGYRSEQIAETAGLSIKEFFNCLQSDLEGQLFPDTYYIKEGINAIELVKILHDNFIKKLGMSTEILYPSLTRGARDQRRL